MTLVYLLPVVLPFYGCSSIALQPAHLSSEFTMACASSVVSGLKNTFKQQGLNTENELSIADASMLAKAASRGRAVRIKGYNDDMEIVTASALTKAEHNRCKIVLFQEYNHHSKVTFSNTFSGGFADYVLNDCSCSSDFKNVYGASGGISNVPTCKNGETKGCFIPLKKI